MSSSPKRAYAGAGRKNPSAAEKMFKVKVQGF